MRRRIATLATCNLNQWAMDFEGNLRRIVESIERARAAGATYRVGPELEVPGYGCEDHFLELDTVEHSWEALGELLSGGHTRGLLCDVGMPVVHRGVLYNCRVLLLDGRILLIRPKLHLANDGNYRETRYFSTWKHQGVLEDHPLPPELRALTGQAKCPFGDGALRCCDALLAAETCEELFTPQAPHISLALAGVEIISNGSGSHHQLRKLHTRLDLIRSATAKAGGVYLYANQQGCDGGRLYYDGCACVAVNGQLVAQGSQFSLADVEVVTASVDLDEVVSYRAAISSLREQASSVPAPALVEVEFYLCGQAGGGEAAVSLPIEPRYHAPEEEIALGPAAWLWDYLRRSGAAGFLLPLSGGADSSSTAAIVGSMCQLVVRAIQSGDAAVLADARRVARYGEAEAVDDARGLAGRLLTTVYMGSENSTRETRDRAALLASEVGCYHLSLSIDTVVASLTALFTAVTGKAPRFRADGGTAAENLALQNIQARLRMVIAFLLAQLTPWARGRSGWLLVLGSANVDEALRGYLTKYDCSAADINPIGGISKGDLRRFLRWGAEHLGYPSLARVEAAPPTAELEPIREGVAPQTDEADMGMSYDDLGIYGRLRKVARCGPVSMYRRCAALWRGTLGPEAVAAKVKAFFAFYAINRHKATVLTPSYHAESYSPDDNRFDHRQFLYNSAWPWQFARIDALVAGAAEGAAAVEGAAPAARGAAS
ncbi:glutamine-dependent NAD(+) synthetase [Raphidocelis subcapitata]|uniref:Glutamine-dependent NAD(+) synthetase n=1 Tax=Raphidocelis subcapitata TaxID=307507 RepID=A0A2V0P7V2_9CHLO|nr:glutamine-dependent NAD(+) synthetase [Raphidocelis subcapitata]|eukprot:GBF95639.1 glutamine-dependent NAD(+) synthetase [Raphidocelis subcapitata]